MKNRTFRAAFKASLPIMAGYLVLGAGFGILLQSKGFAWWWAPVMSLTIYAGSMQYVAVDLLSGGASFVTTAIMTLMVNIRHLFYGISMLRRYKGMGKAKPYLIFSLTDETFSLVCSPWLPDDIDRKKYFLTLSALNQSYWIIGSTLGALIGTALPFDTTGVEFSMTALFVIIFVEQWEKAENHLPAITGVAVTAVCLLIFGSENFLIPSMIAIAVLLFAEKRFIIKEEKKDAVE